MQPSLFSVPILENEPIGADVWRLKLKSVEISRHAKPGQFLLIRVTPNLDPLLPRPFSLCQIRPENNYVTVVYKAGGPGTAWLSRRRKKEELTVLGPLGKPFHLPAKAKRIALVAGGIGVTPLISLGELAKKEKKEIHFFLGLRDKSSMTVTHSMLAFVPKSRRHFSTDNGSFGQRGTIVGHLEAFLKKAPVDYIASCGPRPMLEALQPMAAAAGIKTEVAVEERMACGLGYCLGCTVAIRENGALKHVLACKDGPILSLESLVL